MLRARHASKNKGCSRLQELEILLYLLIKVVITGMVEQGIAGVEGLAYACSPAQNSNIFWNKLMRVKKA